MNQPEGTHNPSRRTFTRRRTFVFALVTIIGVSVLTLLGVEMFLRLTNFHFELRVHIIESTAPEAEQFQRSFEIDSYLIWVNKQYYSQLNRAKMLRPDIVFMGDSCTQFGKYTRDLVRTIEGKKGIHVTSANLAVAGWTTHQGMRQMTRDVAEIKPRIVTIYYGWNDHWLSIGLDDEHIERINTSPLGRLQRYRVGQLLTKTYVALTTDKNEPVVRVSDLAFHENLTAIVVEAKAIGAIPVLITAPTAHKKGKEPAYLEGRWVADLSQLVPIHQKYTEIVRQVAREQDVPLCDLARDYEGLDETLVREKYFMGDGIHFTPRGDQVTAEFLYSCLDTYGLLDDPASQ